ncbi:MAG: glycosyltransferase family 39 protein [Bryobacteraceae bacterium]|nr:glycosyltransferase family 39 protein [Bryobacteraceae bacterium]
MSLRERPFLGRWALAAPLVAAAVVYTLTATGRAIVDADEGVYAHIPQLMLARGDWVTPYVNGVRSLDKPPLLYWLIAVCYRVFGVHEFTARIPSILGILGVAWLLGRMALRAAGLRAGVAAAAAFAFSAGALLFTLEVMHDVLLVFFLTLAAHCFLLAYRRREPSPCPLLGFFAALAGAFLSKGLVGVVFPIGIGAAYALIAKDRPQVRTRHLLLGALLFVAAALPWHIAMEIRNPGFLRVYFFEEQILRFFSKREPVDYESVPLLLFWALIPVWLMPWSLFLSADGLKKGSPRRRRAVLFALCWAGLILAFFSLSSRLEHYAFPLLPPLALLAGIRLAKGVPAWSLRLLTLAGLALLSAAAVLSFVAATGIGLPGGDGFHPERTFANDFTIMTSFSPELIRKLLPPAIFVAAALGVAFLLARWSASSGKVPWSVGALTAAMAVFHLAAAYSIRLSEPIISSKFFGQVLAWEYQPGDQVVVWGDYETANSVNFYMPGHLYVAHGAAPSLGPGLRYPDAPKLLLSDDELREAWNGPGRVFLIVDATRVPVLDLGPMRETAHSAGRVLLVNGTRSRSSPGGK